MSAVVHRYEVGPLCADGEVLAELERQISAAGGVVAWSRKADITHAAVCLVRSGERPVSERIANALGYQQVTAYRRLAKGVA